MASQPLKLSMMITADAKGVRPATEGARRDLAGIGEQAKLTAADARALAAANDEAAAAHRRAMEAATGRSRAERDLKAAVASFAGVREPLAGPDLAARQADVEAYGKRLDALRAKYNPLYAEISRYRAIQAEIRDAHRLGAISVDEMTNALDRERTAALEAMAALKGRRGVLGGGGPAAGSNFHSTNLMFQFQDIGMMSALGQNPMAVALQQGTQVGGIIQQMGGGAAAAGALRGALLALVSPANMAAIAITGASAAAIQYFMSAGREAKTLDDLLEAHEANILRLGPAYDAVRKRQQAFLADSAEVVEFLNAGMREKVLANVAKEMEGALGRVMPSFVNEIGQEVFQMEERFRPFIEIIGRLQQSVADGTPDFQRFNREIAAAGQRMPQTAEAGKELVEMLKSAQKAAAELPNIVENVDRVGLALSQVDAAIAQINPHNLGGRYADVQKEVESLRKKAAEGDLSVKNLNRAIDSMSRMNPDLSAALEPLREFIRLAIEAKRQADGLANTTPKTHRLNALDRIQKDFDFHLRLGMRMGDLPEKLGVGKVDKDSNRDANAYRDLIKSANDRIAQMRLEIELAGKTGAEAERLRFEQDLLADAMDKGRTIGREQRLEIAELARQYGELAEQLAGARLAQDLMFDREQLFRSPIDQQIAAALRGAGLEVDLNGFHAGLIRTNIELSVMKEHTRELAGTVFTGLRNALRDGKLEFEELGDIAINVLDKIIDKIQDEFTDAIAQMSIGGGKGDGGGGGFFSFLGSLFGLGGGGRGLNYFPPAPSMPAGLYHSGRYPGQPGGSRLVDPSWFLDAPRYHSGRIPGLAADEEAAIVRRDEPIFRSMEHARQVVGGMNDNRGGRSETVVRLILPEGFRTEIVAAARQGARDDAVTIVTEYHRARQNLIENGGQG